MENYQNRIHLKNMLSCIGEIENYCIDLAEDQMQDEELTKMLYRNLSTLGKEAARVDIKHPSIFTLKSFEKADFINGLGKDVYAVFNFIINDLEYLKASVSRLCFGRRRIRSKSKYVLA